MHSLLTSKLSFFALCFVLFAHISMAQSKVEVVQENNSWKLLVDGDAFYINGAGGDGSMEYLKSIGGNAIRTWDTKNGQEILDRAHRLGLKVMLGLWVQHERHGFDYNNSNKVKQQLDNFRSEVRKYKDHPALLMWAVGNEYELNYSNTKVWWAVDDIAKMIQEEDPNHPVTTVTAGTTVEKVGFVKSVLKHIDVYGINTYAGIDQVADVLEEADYHGAYMITEWGPTGHWEIAKTRWQASIEQTSTEKAKSYLNRYQNYIEPYHSQCIGSFAFLWGQKQEYTSTWYGLFSEEGKPTEPMDVLEFCWTGNYPDNRAPSIEGFSFDEYTSRDNIIVNPEQRCVVRVEAKDLNGDKLNYRWELYPESTDLKTGGDAEGKPPIIPGKVKKSKSTSILLKAPKKEGRYRLFVTVDDGEKVAYMNIPFYVRYRPESERGVEFKKLNLEPLEY